MTRSNPVKGPVLAQASPSAGAPAAAQNPSRRTNFRVTVFCSANHAVDPDFFSAATQFAKELHARGCELIYGGSGEGLMGHFANEMIKCGGTVRGAITSSLAKTSEPSHPELRELVTVDDLFQRKKWLMDQGDAFVIFPGGLGTADEALEVITWKSLGCHSKPILFVNLTGFWNGLIACFKGFERAGMIRPGGLELYSVCDTLHDVWKCLDESDHAT